MSRRFVSLFVPAVVAALLVAGGCQDQKEEAEKNSAGQMRNGWTALIFIRSQEQDAFAFPADHAAMKTKINRFAQTNPQLKGQLPKGGYGISPLADFVDGDPRPHYRLFADSLDEQAGTVLMMENPALHGGEGAAILVSKGPGKIPAVEEVDKAEAAKLWEGGGVRSSGDGEGEDAPAGESPDGGAEGETEETPDDEGDSEAPTTDEG